MNNSIYQTTTGRALDLERLGEAERQFLKIVQTKYQKGPEWSDFAAWWAQSIQKANLPAKSIVYRVCEDLEARLGIAQGTLAHPDYRDYLADAIEERFGSRYRFCKETGLDPGHLSRVLASRSDLSLDTLQRVLEKLHLELVVQPEDQVARRVSPNRAIEALAAASK